MSPTSNDAAAKSSAPASTPVSNPRAFPTAPAAPSLPGSAATSGGGKSTLKLMIPIVALVAVIFGITFFAQYSPRSDDPITGPKGSGEDPPLRFFTSTRAWDPPSLLPPSKTQPLDYRGLPLLAPSATPHDPDFPFRFSVADRAFPAFYEVKDDAAGLKHAASFWFENPHQKPVSLQLKAVSCSSCSGGRVADIPPDVARQLLQMSRVSALPQGLVSGLSLGMIGPAANLDERRLNWQQAAFRDNPHARYTIPPAGDNSDGWTPQWGILQLQFSVGAVGVKQLSARFETAVEGTPLIAENTFGIACEGVNAFDLTRTTIDLGELSEKSEARQFEVIAFSRTRGSARNGPGEMGDLVAPSASVRMPLSLGGDPGEFVQISAPERIPDAELGRVAEMIAEQSQRQTFVNVEGAYRYTVSVHPKVKDRSIDIGLLERDIWFTLPGAQERQLRVRGMVSGVVWLDNNSNDIDVETVALSKGLTITRRLITAQRDLPVTLVQNGWSPKFLDIKMDKDPNPPSADRGYYKLTIRVPSLKENARVPRGTWNGEIVLEVKGTTVQRIRIPIKGRIGLN